MSAYQADGRKLWLDEGLVNAGNFLTLMVQKERKRELSQSEQKFKQMAAAFIYLYEKSKQAGVLDETDDFYLFDNETIH